MKYILLTAMSFLMATTLWHPLALRVASVHQPAAQDTTSLSGEWFLQPVLASDTATGRIPVLRFSVGHKTFTGFTGCNQMSGNFLLEGDMLHFNEKINLTRMACEGYNEKEFLINLLRVDRYKIKDGVLWLMAEQTPLSRWMKRTAGKQVV